MTDTQAHRAKRFRQLFGVFSRLAGSKGLGRVGARLPPHARRAESALRNGEEDEFESAVTAMYCLLHSPETGYRPEERSRLQEHRAYGCHAGGLEPILRSAPYISPQTRLADFGAGNGLQGLLFQLLYPHLETIQIELSAALIEQGRRLQQQLGIATERIRWLHRDMNDIDPEGLDVIYLYRPFQPVGPGKRFYENFGARLSELSRTVHVISVADCLEPHLDPSFCKDYDDGHLRIFTGSGSRSAAGLEASDILKPAPPVDAGNPLCEE